MYVNAFQVHKVRQEIRVHGTRFQFERPAKNKYGEPTDYTTQLYVHGLFHTTSSYVQSSSTEYSTARTKASPMIMCLWEEAKELKHNDFLRYSGKKYLVNEITNLMESNLIADVSLEEVQEG